MTTQAPVDDLDALFIEAMSIKAQSDALKSARERQRRATGTPSERAEDARLIAQWEAANEWASEANIAVYHRFECRCGHHQTVFEGVMLRQRHRRQSSTVRHTAVDFLEMDQELPKRIAVRKTEADMCVRCTSYEGFDFHNIDYWSI